MLREKQIVRTDKAPKPAGQYSQGVSAGNFVFVAGQVGIDPQTRIAPKRISAQTKQCLENIKAILSASGATLDSMVRVGVYLRNMEDFAAMNKLFELYFQEFPPARTTIQAVFASDFLIEIDAIALKS
jgi:2-iminobutanoate/2-iminopropanoate deaminase